MLAYGDPESELAGWCLRMLVEPSAAERAVLVADRAGLRAGLDVLQDQERSRDNEGKDGDN